jgi:hypothetical protein
MQADHYAHFVIPVRVSFGTWIGLLKFNSYILINVFSQQAKVSAKGSSQAGQQGRTACNTLLLVGSSHIPGQQGT